MERAPNVAEGRWRGGRLSLLLSTGVPAAVVLAAWNAVETTLGSHPYRAEPSRAVELFLLALAIYAPLVLVPEAVLSLALAWRARSPGPRDDRASHRGIAAGIAAAWIAIGILASRGPAVFLTSGSTWLDGSIAGAAAVACGLVTRRLSIESARSSGVARALRVTATLVVGLTIAVLGWAAIRDRLQVSARSLQGIFILAAAVMGGLIAGALLAGAFRLARRATRRGGRLRGAKAILLLAIAAGAGAAASAWNASPNLPAGEAAASRPNVVLIVADTLRADHVGCYGAARTRTPALDALAARGARAERAYASASWTRPATASILTGLYPGAHGVRGYKDRLLPGVTTIPEVFKGAGYATAGIVANPLMSSRFGLNRGFELWEEETAPGRLQRHTDAPLVMTLAALHLWSAPTTFAAADTVVDRALSWLDGNRARPCFLYVHFMDPHDPYAPPPPFDALYGRFENPRWTMGFGTLQQIMQGKIRVEGEDFDRLQSLYDGAISSMDDQIGRFVRGLESRGLSKSTLVYFIGDHGEEFIDHGGLGHARSLYEELVHVPLIVEGPGVRPGLVLEKPVRSIDLAPTILESAGLRFPRPVEGGSIWGALSRGEVAPSPAIYMEETYTGERSAFHLFRSVRVGDLKLIGSSFFLQGGGPWRWELYDLASDPGERRDLASARPADVSRLRERIQLRVKLHERRRASAIRGDDSELRQQLHALGYIE